MTVPFLALDRIYAEIGPELDRAFARVMRSGRFVLGAEVDAFEREFAAYCGVAHCVGVGNGLDALTLALRAWDIGPGHEVIVPANTFIATWFAVTHAGATPVPVEPDPRTFNLDPARVEAAIGPRTRALIPVHLYGQAADMTALREIAARRGLRVLEDAAQAVGARHRGRRVGALGDAAAFSFYPTKNLGAFGDGGAVTTNDAALAERLRRLRSYGSTVKYRHAERGFNSRLDELQAALLRACLPRLDAWNARRALLAQRYALGLAGSRFVLPEVAPGNEHVWHLFVIRSRDRDALQRSLEAAGIGTMIHYPVPPHLQPAYAGLGLARGALPVAEAIHDEVLSLPMGTHLDEAAVDRVVAELRRI